MFFGKKQTAKGSRGEPMPLENHGPPDSERPAGLCPRCEKQSSFECIHSLPLTFDGGYIVGRGEPNQATYNERITLLICRHCNQGVLVLEEQWIGEHRAKEHQGGGTVSWRGFHWWPLAGARLHTAIPAAIQSVYNEGVLALAANCPRAAAVMARRTLEAVAVEKGETSGTLAQRLNNLSSKGLLHPSLVEWVKEVRLVGNAGAHYDPMDTIDAGDAQQLIDFIRELLNYLYVLPWELNARRAAKP
jgi:hypothetical protein